MVLLAQSPVAVARADHHGAAGVGGVALAQQRFRDSTLCRLPSALFVVSYIGIAISLWPNIVPYRFSLWQAASSESTQAFLLVGTLFLLPIILMYTGWSYWVFRGKVRADIGYH